MGTLRSQRQLFFCVFRRRQPILSGKRTLGLENHFTSPPNAFDEFATFPLVRAKTDAEQRLEAMQTLERLIQERGPDQGDAVISAIFNSRLWKLTHPKWLARFRLSMR